MTNILHCDLCVLGGGGAGVAAARTAAALRAKVVIVEKRALGGAYLAQDRAGAGLLHRRLASCQRSAWR